MESDQASHDSKCTPKWSILTLLGLREGLIISAIPEITLMDRILAHNLPMDGVPDSLF